MSRGDDMTLFDMALLDFLLLLVSLCVAFIFQSFEETFNNQKNSLYFDLGLITSFYLILRYGSSNKALTIVFLNIPLLLSAIKKRNISYFSMTLFLILICSYSYPNKIIIVIIEYFICSICYIGTLENKKRSFLFTSIFLLVQILSFISLKTITKETIYILAFFCIVSLMIESLANKIEGLLEVTNSIKQLQEEKRLRTSLFKITHEIKNPIAVCSGYLQMFDVNNLEHSRKYIPIIQHEINRVLTLLEDFLSITKIKLQKEEIDIYYLLEEATNNLKPILKEKNVSLSLDIPDDELYIEADYNRLNQVLINMIKNSIEAIKKKGFIEIKTKREKNNVIIIIQDNGEGISKANLKKMNEPFFTTKSKGTGLGVFLSKEIIKAHKGKMNYFSKIGKGTKVKITLPLKKDIKNS